MQPLLFRCQKGAEEGGGCNTHYSSQSTLRVWDKGCLLWPTTAFSFFGVSSPVGCSKLSLAADSACLIGGEKELYDWLICCETLIYQFSVFFSVFLTGWKCQWKIKKCKPLQHQLIRQNLYLQSDKTLLSVPLWCENGWLVQTLSSYFFACMQAVCCGLLKKYSIYSWHFWHLE